MVVKELRCTAATRWSASAVHVTVRTVTLGRERNNIFLHRNLLDRRRRRRLLSKRLNNFGLWRAVRVRAGIGAAAAGASIFANLWPLRGLPIAIGSPSAHSGRVVISLLNSSIVPTPSGTSHTFVSWIGMTTGYLAASRRGSVLERMSRAVPCTTLFIRWPDHARVSVKPFALSLNSTIGLPNSSASTCGCG